MTILGWMDETPELYRNISIFRIQMEQLNYAGFKGIFTGKPDR